MSSKAEAREPIDRRLQHHMAWPVVVRTYGAPDQEKPQNGSLGERLPAEVAVDNPPEVTTHSLQQDAALNARSLTKCNSSGIGRSAGRAF